MSATWTNEQLNDYIDDRLNAHQRVELESAMKEDPSARQALDELKKIRSLVRKAPRFKPRKSLAPVVVQAIGSQASQDRADRAAPQPVLSQRETTSANFGNFDFRTAAAAIASLAACLLFVILFAPSPLQKDASLAEFSPPQESDNGASAVGEPDPESVISSDVSHPTAGPTVTAGDEKSAGSQDAGNAKMVDGTSTGHGDTRDATNEDLIAQPGNESGAPQGPDAQIARKSESESGRSSRFDEIILVRTNRTNIDSAFRLLALQPIPPDSFHSPDGGIQARKGGNVLEDKSPRPEKKDESESIPDPAESPATGDKPLTAASEESRSLVMAHYVSVEGTLCQLDELLGQVNAEVDRFALPAEVTRTSSEESSNQGDTNAAAEGTSAAGSGTENSKPASEALAARELSPDVFAADSVTDNSARAPMEGSPSRPTQGRKRFLLIFLESFAPGVAGNNGG
jgi:anti-sigma factor RsiW